MTREDVFAGLKEVLAMVKPKLDLSKLTTNDNLITDLMIDSLSLMMLSLAIENKWGIVIASDAHFDTVNDVIDYVCANS